MNQALNWLLAAAALGSAAWAVFAPRPRTVGVAVAANTLCVAALCARLSAPLVAAAAAILGVGLLFLAPQATPHTTVSTRAPRLTPAAVVTLAGGLLIGIALASIFYVGYAPGQLALGASPAPPHGADAPALALALLDAHGPAVLVAALLALAVAVSRRLRREGC